MVEVILQMIISRYLHENYAASNTEAARREIADAIERKRGEFGTLIAARRTEIEAAQAEGQKVILHVVVDTNWASTDIGTVLTRAEVGGHQLVFEGGPQPPPCPPPRPGGVAGDLFRDITGVTLRCQAVDIELPGTDQEAARRSIAHRLVEAKLRLQMRQPPDFELLIIEALEKDQPLGDLREYARYRAQLAAGSEDPVTAMEARAYWEVMAELVDGPVEWLIEAARHKNLPLDGILRTAERRRDLATQSDPRQAAYWSNVVRLIKAR